MKNHRSKGLELWHTLATLFALHLCGFITLAPLRTDTVSHGMVTRLVDELPWLWLLVAVGALGCLYLLKQLWEQAVAFIANKRHPRSRHAFEAPR
jgi:hypothetical protein